MNIDEALNTAVDACQRAVSATTATEAAEARKAMMTALGEYIALGGCPDFVVRAAAARGRMMRGES